jgi:hypothetical protein
LADGLELAQIRKAALGRPQECLDHSLTGFVIAAVGQFPANGLQRHVQIRGGSPVKLFHDLTSKK